MMAWRLIAWFAARRTRKSRNGFGLPSGIVWGYRLG